MRNLLAGSLAAVLILLPSRSFGAADRLQSLAENGAALDARIEVKRLAASKLTPASWARLRRMIIVHPEWGSDLLGLLWDRLEVAGSFVAEEDSNVELAEADRLMLSKQFGAAEAIYQTVLTSMDPRDPARNHVRVALARAQYGQKKFSQSLKTYMEVTSLYPRFRQALFEKMWAAFRSGDVDLALGAVASQRSAFFSKYIEPEAYLVEIYLLKRLCREKEGDRTFEEVRRFEADLKSGKYDYREWARSEPATRALLVMADSAREDDSSPEGKVRWREAQKITTLLKRSFEIQKARLQEELKAVISFAVLAVIPGVNSGLKPVEKIKDRAALLKSGREIWPADDTETWADEVGRHQYMGESLCGVKAEP